MVSTFEPCLPPPRRIPQTLTVRFKDGKEIKVPYIDYEGSVGYLKGLRDIADCSVSYYKGE